MRYRQPRSTPWGCRRWFFQTSSHRAAPEFFILPIITFINASGDLHLQISSSGDSSSLILRGHAPPPSFSVCFRPIHHTRYGSSMYSGEPQVPGFADARHVPRVVLSYYEIHNDKVFDLFEPPEKRQPSGLPLREKDGKTMVSCKYVKAKTSVKGRDPNSTAKFIGDPLRRANLADNTGPDKMTVPNNENDASANDKSSSDHCESILNAKHNSNMDLHAVELVHQGAPERLGARHVDDVLVCLPDLGYEGVDVLSSSSWTWSRCHNLVLDDVLAFEDVIADASRPDLEDLLDWVEPAFLNIFPSRLCGPLPGHELVHARCVFFSNSYVQTESGTMDQTTDNPDILVAEMMLNGELVYLGTLSMDGKVVLKPVETTGRLIEDEEQAAPSVQGLRLYQREEDIKDEVAHGGAGIQVRFVVGHRPSDPRPVRKRRLVKCRPNTTKMIRRSFMAVVSDGNVWTGLYDFAASGREFIVSAGMLKFQELEITHLSNHPYMVADSNINTSRLLEQKFTVRILNYDANSIVLKPVKAITRSFGNVLVFEGTFQDFLVLENIIECLTPREINPLMSINVPVHGVGFIYNAVEDGTLRAKPVTQLLVPRPHHPRYATVALDGLLVPSSSPLYDGVIRVSSFMAPILKFTTLPNGFLFAFISLTYPPAPRINFLAQTKTSGLNLSPITAFPRSGICDIMDPSRQLVPDLEVLVGFDGIEEYLEGGRAIANGPSTHLHPTEDSWSLFANFLLPCVVVFIPAL
ncbi:hypothetical protein Landi51_13017 [Colletotrichum acutatum]